MRIVVGRYHAGGMPAIRQTRAGRDSRRRRANGDDMIDEKRQRLDDADLTGWPDRVAGPAGDLRSQHRDLAG